MPSQPDLPYKKGPLKFPLENQEEYNTKVSIQAIRVDNIRQIANLVSSSETVNEFIGGSPNEQQTQEQASQKRGRAAASATAQTNFRNMNTYFIEGAKADLYLPVSLVFSDRLAYSTPDLGVIGSGVATGLSNAQDIPDIVTQSVQSALGAFGDLANLITTGNIDAASTTAAKIAGARAAATNFLGQGDAASIGLRVTVAPNTRARFQNVGIRRFTFDFKFIPKSRAEAEEVENMIKMFRFHAYPTSLTNDANIPAAYDYPDMFKIKIMYNKAEAGGGRQFRPIGQQIKLCYLEGINVVQNPTSQVYHSDGTPVETNLTLNFLEYRTLNRNDITQDINELDPDLVNAARNRQGS